MGLRGWNGDVLGLDEVQLLPCLVASVVLPRALERASERESLEAVRAQVKRERQQVSSTDSVNYPKDTALSCRERVASAKGGGQSRAFLLVNSLGHFASRGDPLLPFPPPVQDVSRSSR